MLVAMPAPGNRSSTTATARSQALDWVGLACRLALGAVLLVAGALKITNLESSVLAVRGYQLLPYEVSLVVGYMLPILEILIGLLLITGLLTRFGAAVGTLLMIAFIIGIASAWARGISIDCGCFGGGGEIAAEEAVKKYPVEIARDVALAAAGIWLLVRPSSKFSLDRAWLGPPDFGTHDFSTSDHTDDARLDSDDTAPTGDTTPSTVKSNIPGTPGTKTAPPHVESTDVAPTNPGTKEDLTR